MADRTSLSRHRVRSPAQVAGLEPTAGGQYGHARNARRSGSRLPAEETGKVASYQNAAGLQVTCTRLTAGPFGIHIPNGPGACPSAAGIAEADEIDVARCLQVQRPAGPCDDDH
jgi:homospermidine synthase